LHAFAEPPSANSNGEAGEVIVAATLSSCVFLIEQNPEPAFDNRKK